MFILFQNKFEFKKMEESNKIKEFLIKKRSTLAHFDKRDSDNFDN